MDLTTHAYWPLIYDYSTVRASQKQKLWCFGQIISLGGHKHPRRIHSALLVFTSRALATRMNHSSVHAKLDALGKRPTGLFGG
jgi:hypothetical protein